MIDSGLSGTRRRRILYRCRECDHHFSETAGTIFHDTRLELRTWFLAIYLMGSIENGIRPAQLETYLGISHETALNMVERLRAAIKEDKHFIEKYVRLSERSHGRNPRLLMPIVLAARIVFYEQSLWKGPVEVIMKPGRVRLSGAGFVLLAMLTAPPGIAQNAAVPLAFEAASVKVAPFGPNGVRGGCHGIDSVYSPQRRAEAAPLGRCVITDARLSHLIGIAYGASMLNLKTGPDWIQRGDLRFNVEAKTDDPSKTTEQQLLTMLQNLLVERFKLKFHQETTETAGFALLITKNGSKLEPSRNADTQLLFTGPQGVVVGKPLPGQPISMTARKVSIPALLSLLSAVGGHGPGIDRTGLTGEYDFKLAWDEVAGPDLSTALREQLGLRMEAEKVPVLTFVVDSAEKPGPD